MAATDIHFQEGEGQCFIVEFPAVVHVGVLADVVFEADGRQFPVLEVPEVEAGGGNIFIMSE
jgi:hypothetical protein